MPSISYRTGTKISPITTQSIKYSTYLPKNSSIDPLFISGLFDAEGSFVTTILKKVSNRMECTS